eukprot:Nk52_evm28s270 gene=Nk52_evmTU28s270
MSPIPDSSPVWVELAQHKWWPGIIAGSEPLPKGEEPKMHVFLCGKDRVICVDHNKVVKYRGRLEDYPSEPYFEGPGFLHAATVRDKYDAEDVKFLVKDAYDRYKNGDDEVPVKRDGSAKSKGEMGRGALKGQPGGSGSKMVRSQVKTASQKGKIGVQESAKNASTVSKDEPAKVPTRRTRRGNRENAADEISCSVCYEIFQDLPLLHKHAVAMGHEATLSFYPFFECPLRDCSFICFDKNELLNHQESAHPTVYNQLQQKGRESSSSDVSVTNDSVGTMADDSEPFTNSSVVDGSASFASKPASRTSGRNSSLHEPQAFVPHKNHMRVSALYQAEVKTFVKPTKTEGPYESRSTLVWDPNSIVPESELNWYLSVANSNLVPMPNRDIDFALNALSKHKYCVREALLYIMKNRAPNSSILDLMPEWSKEEEAIFASCYSKYGKNFVRIQKRLPKKKVSELVKYYYKCKKRYPSKFYKLKETRSTASLNSEDDTTGATSATLSDTSSRIGKTKSKTKVNVSVKSAVIGTMKSKKQAKKGERRRCTACKITLMPTSKKSQGPTKCLACELKEKAKNSEGVSKLPHTDSKSDNMKIDPTRTTSVGEEENLRAKESAKTTRTKTSKDTVTDTVTEKSRLTFELSSPSRTGSATDGNTLREASINSKLGNPTNFIDNTSTDIRIPQSNSTDIEEAGKLSSSLMFVTVPKSGINKPENACSSCSSCASNLWRMSKSGVVCNSCFTASH